MMKQLFILALCLAMAQSRILQSSDILDSITSVFQASINLISLTKEVDYSFDYTVPEPAKNIGIDFAPFLFGTHEGRESEGTPVKLHVDTSLSMVALASGALAVAPTEKTAKDAWGIDCTATAKTNCTYVADQIAFTNDNCPTELKSYTLTSAGAMTTAVPYWSATAVACRKGQTFMRWANSSLPDGTTGGDLAKLLPVTLFETEPTTGVSAGYLGLAPGGEFFNYVTSHTDWDKKNDVLFGLSLTPNSGASKLVDDLNKDLWKQNQFVIHGKRNGGSPQFYSPLIDKAISWTIGFANFTLSDGETSDYTVVEDLKVCLSSKYPLMIGFNDEKNALALTKYFNTVCKSGSAADCAEDNTDKSKVKKVQLGFSNKALPVGTTVVKDFNSYNVTMDPTDFLYFNKKEFSSLIGQKAIMGDWGCDATADMVVGRAFLSRNEAVMNVTKTGKSLAFISNEGTSSIFLIILIILGCIILAICIAIILLKVCKRKTDNDEYQRTE